MLAKRPVYFEKNPPNQIGSLPEKNPHLFYEMCYIMTM